MVNQLMNTSEVISPELDKAQKVSFVFFFSFLHFFSFSFSLFPFSFSLLILLSRL